MSIINLSKKFEKISDHWAPKVIAEMNDYQFKLAKVEGEFVWHVHEGTDETFIILDGELTIEFRDRTLTLSKGEMRLMNCLSLCGYDYGYSDWEI